MASLARIEAPHLLLDSRIVLENAFPDISQRPGAAYNTSFLTLHKELIRNTDIIREFLRNHLHRRLTWTSVEKSASLLEYKQGKAPVMYSEFVDISARFIVALLGGLCLIIPMLVMSFDASQTKSLVTVSVAVVLFAMAMSLAFKTSNKDTLTATATYAAVLVVFVGTGVPVAGS